MTSLGKGPSASPGAERSTTASMPPKCNRSQLRTQLHGDPHLPLWLILKQIPSMLLYLQSLQAADMKKIIKAL